jgi:hypothetical protein
MNTLAYLGMYGAKPINSQAKNAVGFKRPTKKKKKHRRKAKPVIVLRRVKNPWLVDLMKEVIAQCELEKAFARK